jgi:hypothetical protein
VWSDREFRSTGGPALTEALRWKQQPFELAKPGGFKAPYDKCLLTPTAKNGAAKAASARIATQFIAAGAKFAEILEQSDQYRASMMIARAQILRSRLVRAEDARRIAKNFAPEFFADIA